ncbi:MAG TPA: phospholipase A [Pseudodesulfovibrio sp.]|nr:phospholipase A [Pseudodesulfovibrio sp.]
MATIPTMQVPPTAAPAPQAVAQAATAGASLPNPFHISLYKPTYVLPAYFTADPDQAVYAGNTPEGQTIGHTEVKFQFSLKIPVITRIAGTRLSWFGAYTQLSYWQAYAKSAFFRESNYEPETFLEYDWRKTLPWGWRLEAVDLGAKHQSNGRGGDLERSWNRAYLGGTLAHERWTLNLQAWYPFHDQSLRDHNPDIARYLGYGRWVLSYHPSQRQSISLLSRNNITSGFSRGAWQLTWSFPLLERINGYLQIFSGYGQSLIEYDHRSRAVGLGVTLNDW